MTHRSTYENLFKQMKETVMLRSTRWLLEYDRETCMPEKGDDFRADQVAQLTRLEHDSFVDPGVGDRLSALESSDLMNDPESPEAVNVKEWRRVYDREVKLPGEFVAEFSRVTSRAFRAWSNAKSRSDFSIFKPHLEEIVRLCQEKADLIGFTTERYDALLDEFEPGGKVAEIDRTFAELRPALVDLLARIGKAKRRPDLGIIKQPYDLTRQKLFAESVGAAIGFDFKAGRFDNAAHPSCNMLGPHDMRIMTRYYPEDFAEGLTAATHEVGHAIYDLTRKSDELWGTPAVETASLAIHESQSRLWENIVGRSREFWAYFFPQLQRFFPEQTRGVGLDQFYGAMNHVAPSYIRVEADEATYNLHIMLRYELERAIIDGSLKIDDIPGEWNRRFKEYLGIEVPDDAHGCLQDIHWSAGMFGYFPTYALGNLYAAQFWSRAEKDLPGLRDDFKRGEFGRLFDWLGENIHSRGATYLAGELCERVTGEPLSHKFLIDYLQDKYSEIYGI